MLDIDHETVKILQYNILWDSERNIAYTARYKGSVVFRKCKNSPVVVNILSSIAMQVFVAKTLDLGFPGNGVKRQICQA